VDVCPEGSYIVISEMKCYACDSTCKTCFGGAGNSCLTCPTGSLFYMNECVDSCPDGFRISTSGLACETDADTRLERCSY
jgi:proprotein convertase subtilisin/kexin type 5